MAIVCQGGVRSGIVLLVLGLMLTFPVAGRTDAKCGRFIRHITLVVDAR